MRSEKFRADFLKFQSAIIISLILTINCCLIIFSPNRIFAAHPLETDDSGTLGKGSMQVELTGEYGKDEEYGVTEQSTEIAIAFGYGILKNLDCIIGLPYQDYKVEAESESIEEKGVSDISVEVKWNFFEVNKFGFALKPGISLPTGNEDKGLGTGKLGYSAFLISTLNLEPVMFHFNFGYIRNENKFEEEKNLWYASLACEYAIGDISLVADIGSERNTDHDADADPLFILFGLIYSINDNIAIDAGFKYGLNDEETDYSVLAGLTASI